MFPPCTWGDTSLQLKTRWRVVDAWDAGPRDRLRRSNWKKIDHFQVVVIPLKGSTKKLSCGNEGKSRTVDVGCGSGGFWRCVSWWPACCLRPSIVCVGRGPSWTNWRKAWSPKRHRPRLLNEKDAMISRKKSPTSTSSSAIHLEMNSNLRRSCWSRGDAAWRSWTSAACWRSASRQWRGSGRSASCRNWNGPRCRGGWPSGRAPPEPAVGRVPISSFHLQMRWISSLLNFFQKYSRPQMGMWVIQLSYQKPGAQTILSKWKDILRKITRLNMENK